jgi:hypothetical protein
MHYQADNVNDIKGKVTNPIMYKIAQNIVNNRYLDGDKRFFLYIHNFGQKIEGKFTKKEFEQACRDYMLNNKKIIKEYRDVSGCSQEEAIKGQTEIYMKQYYGNS